MKRVIAPVLLALAVTLAAAATGCAKRAVAKVDGDTITEEQFYSALQDAAGRQVLDRMILERLLELKAKEKGVTVTEVEITQAYDREKQRAGPEQWQEQMRASGRAEDAVKRDLRDTLLLGKLVVVEPELKRFYEENRTRFDEPPTATYRRIVVKSKAEAGKIRGDIIAGKVDFVQAVKEYSQDPAPFKDRGGEVGPVTEGTADPKVAPLLFSLKAGEVSEPIEAAYPQGTYQIVQVVNRTEGKKSTYDQVQDQVLQAYIAMHRAEIAQFVNDLRSGASVTVFLPRYQSLAEQYQKLKEQKPPQIPTTPAPAPQQPQGQQPPPPPPNLPK